MDRYADLRAALADGWVQSIHPDTVRDLLVDYDNFAHILDGLLQDAVDGGWTAAGISAHAKRLEEENARLREVLSKARVVIQADKDSLVDCHAVDGVIPEYDEEGLMGLAEYEIALGAIDEALAQEQGGSDANT